MGHNTLGVIPRNVKWRRVTDLLGSGAASAEIFAASATAAENDLIKATDDPVFVEAVRLMLGIPAAARSDDFGDAVRRLGIRVGTRQELLDLLVATSARLEEVRRSSPRRTDLGELAARALNTTLTRAIGDGLPGLLETTPEDVRMAARQLSSSRGIADLSRGFFANVTQAAISYWLERAFADHAGPGDRLSSTAGRGDIDAELRAYAHEATRIINEFSGGWYAKTLHERGRISDRDAAAFGAVCIKKIVAELRIRRSEDA